MLTRAERQTKGSRAVCVFENPTELALKCDADSATWTIAGDAECYRLSEERRVLLSILEHADEPIRRKKITETLNARGKAMKNCAVYEMLSQMAKDGQVKTLGRYVYSSFQEDA